jgi:hypothetical protein
MNPTPKPPQLGLLANSKQCEQRKAKATQKAGRWRQTKQEARPQPQPLTMAMASWEY